MGSLHTAEYKGEVIQITKEAGFTVYSYTFDKWTGLISVGAALWVSSLQVINTGDWRKLWLPFSAHTLSTSILGSKG